MPGLFSRKKRTSDGEQSSSPASYSGPVNGTRPEMWAATPYRYMPTPPSPSQPSMNDILTATESLSLEGQNERKTRQLEVNASIETIRKLRDLIREKRRMDMKIWADRDVQDYDRNDVLRECKKADELQEHIRNVVRGWGPEQFPDPKEWQLAKKIQDTLLDTKYHIHWMSKQPWERVEEMENDNIYM